VDNLKELENKYLQAAELGDVEALVELGDFYMVISIAQEDSMDIDGQLTDLLDHCQELAKGENDIQTAFFRLLRVLVERQNPQALSLQDKLN